MQPYEAVEGGDFKPLLRPFRAPHRDVPTEEGRDVHADEHVGEGGILSFPLGLQPHTEKVMT